VATIVRSVVAEYDPNFETMGCDEAYLDMTEHLAIRTSTPEPKILLVNDSFEGCCRCSSKLLNSHVEVERKNMNCENCLLIKPGTIHFDNSVADAVEEMRLKIFLKTKLTASAGVGPNAPLAKICSDQNKPNGQFLLQFCRDEIMTFVGKLPIRKWPFIGKVQEKALNSLGVFNIKDLFEFRGKALLTASSEGSFQYYMEAFLGIGRNRICGKDGERKSISTETTFSTMIDKNEMFDMLEKLCKDLSDDCSEKGFSGKTVTLKLKKDDFKVISRSTSLGYTIHESDKLIKVISPLLSNEIQKNPGMAIRLMGVRISHLEEIGKRSGIDKFFREGKESTRHTQNYPCPNCDAFTTHSLSDLNQHLDKCLNKNTNPSLCSDPIIEPDIQSDDLHSGDIHSDEDLFPEEECSTDLTYNLEIFSCPICNVCIPGNLQSFNRHIDDCINKDKSLLDVKLSRSTYEIQDQTKNKNKSRKRKSSGNEKLPKVRKIDSYFVKS